MERNKLIYLIIGIAVVIGAVYYIFSVRSSMGTLEKYRDQPANPQVLVEMQQASMNNSLANKIGVGIASRLPTLVTGAPLVIDGRPGVVYVGGDFCPFCAITRWGLIVALMRFGNFTGLHYTTSSTKDVFPDVATFSFYNSSYSSPYITFDSVELATANDTPLQKPDGLETAVMNAYAGSGGIPFIDFGNRSVVSGTLVTPIIIQGKDWQQITSVLQESNSTVAAGVIGSANIFTAQICMLTNNTPASVCNQLYVQEAANGKTG
jgi:hypothetical protein